MVTGAMLKILDTFCKFLSEKVQFQAVLHNLQDKLILISTFSKARIFITLPAWRCLHSHHFILSIIAESWFESRQVNRQSCTDAEVVFKKSIIVAK